MRALITFLKLTYLRLPFVMSQVIIPMWKKRKNILAFFILNVLQQTSAIKAPELK